MKGCLANKRGVTRESLYYYLVLLCGCVLSDGSLNRTKADLVMSDNSYVSCASLFDRYRSLNNYVMNPCEVTLFDLVRIFSVGDSFRSLAGVIKCVVGGEVPGYIEGRMSFSLESGVLMSYLVLASEVAVFDNFDTFVSNLISKLVV